MSKDWTGNKRSTFVTLGASSHSTGQREQHDYYATDPQAIDALNKILDLEGKQIWEPACGGGHLVDRMREKRASVVASDLIDRGSGDGGIDFLQAKHLLAPIIVTNPPYKYALEFVQKSIDLGADTTCMFLKITFLEGQKRRKFFDEHPPKTVAVFSKRITCAINGEDFSASSAACYAWFIWEKGYSGKPEVVWL